MSLSNGIDISFHKKQGIAFETEATEVLYGGAAGGGKSFLMRAAAVIWCSNIPGLQVYIFRRIREDLIKNHVEGPKGLRALLAPWVISGHVQIVDEEIRFWNGSKIYLCHCKDEKDRYKYLGAEIHVLLIDELTTFTEAIYRFLRGRVRSVGLPALPKEYKGKFPRILSSSNPGNVGHLWVKQAFIDNVEQNSLAIRKMPDEEGGMLRQFISAKIEDNPSLVEDDPMYRSRLKGLGSETLVRAMEQGDWSVIEGAYFDNWSDKLIVKPFEIPKNWTRFRAFDWGSAKPFSVGWWAVSEGIDVDGMYIPQNALVRYREWYGCKPGKTNVGLKLVAEQVAQGIRDREGDENIAFSVADPSIFSEDGGPSIAQRMASKKVYFRKADNKRTSTTGVAGGWDLMRFRIEGEDGKPMIYCFTTCLDSIRTIPQLQHDPDRAEDIDSDMEDHAADEWRYACKARPWMSTKVQDIRKRDRWMRIENQYEEEGERNWKVA